MAEHLAVVPCFAVLQGPDLAVFLGVMVLARDLIVSLLYLKQEQLGFDLYLSPDLNNNRRTFIAIECTSISESLGNQVINSYFH